MAWLTGEINKEFEGSTVVVTHHFPHKNSCYPAHAASLNTAAYGSKFPEDLLRCSNLWLHGHTHHNVNYRIGDSKKYVRVMCNPRGLPYLWYRSYENEGFNPNLLIERLPDGNWAERFKETCKLTSTKQNQFSSSRLKAKSERRMASTTACGIWLTSP